MPPDDAADVDTQVGAIDGIDNHPIGFILARVWRLLKLVRTTLADQRTTLADHEARIRKLEGPGP